MRRGRKHHDDGEDDDTDTIVEQAFAGNLGLQRRRDMDGLQDAQHRDRIGRRDESTEDQAVEKRNGKAQEVGRGIGKQADHRGRDQDTHGGHRQDRPLARDQGSHVHMQGTGEQQEAEHPFEQGVVEVGQLQRRGDGLSEAEAGDQSVEKDRSQRSEKGDDHQADCLRQAQQAVVQVAEDGRQHDDDRREVEEREMGHGDYRLSAGR
jgi:hypothetical protein